MNKSCVVYGPQGCGKTLHAKRIAKHLGLSKIVEADDAILQHRRLSPTDTLYLTCMSRGEIDRVFPDFRRVMAFADLPAHVRS
jgi:cytidylate kinase